MNKDAIAALKKVNLSKCPEDLFGTEFEAKTNYRKLCSALHEDKFKDEDEKQKVGEAFKIVQIRWKEAEDKFEKGTYGKPRGYGTIIQSPIGELEVIEPTVSKGHFCETFSCRNLEGQEFVLKILKNKLNSDLMEREQQFLKKLSSNSATEANAKFLSFLVPELVETFVFEGHLCHLIKKPEGFFSLEEIIAKVGPIDGRTLAWMFNRTMQVLLALHNYKFIHGSPTKDHLLFNPEDHTIRIVDWCYSAAAGEKILAYNTKNAEYRKFFPGKQEATTANPKLDIFVAGQTFLNLPCKDLPPALLAVLRSCAIQDPERRESNALKILDSWNQQLKINYGQHKFHRFEAWYKLVTT